ncbi:MAG: PIN domain-containing protein [Holophagales bacterium]|nr:PIN domain-containing protein [Holophagales bacterium]
MKLAYDTSVLVAAVLESHSHHPRARPWARAATSSQVDALISWHAAAETWSVLTRLPGALQLAPAEANLVVDRLLQSFRAVEISGGLYRAAMRRCSERGARSGALFDALHLVVAEAEGAEALLTFNDGDFERLRSETSPRVLLPPDPPSAQLPTELQRKDP